MGILDHLTCLLRNLYAGQEARVRTGHVTTVWFQIRNGVHQSCILSACLFNFYARLYEAQAGIQTAGEVSIKSLRYADGTTVIAETEEELKSLLMKVKEESERIDLKLNIQKEQDGIGVDGSGVHLSPRIHQEYTFRHRSSFRTFAETRQEYLTRGKEYREPHKIQ